MVVIFILVAVLLVTTLVAAHWFLWRRLVRDTTRGPGPARRAGTVLFVVAPLLMIAALVASRTGIPFRLQRALAWPGYLWMAVLLYLLLWTLAGEVVRPVLRRVLERRARRTAASGPASVAESASGTQPEGTTASGSASEGASAASEGESAARTVPGTDPARTADPAPDTATTAPSPKRVAGTSGAAADTTVPADGAAPADTTVPATDGTVTVAGTTAGGTAVEDGTATDGPAPSDGTTATTSTTTAVEPAQPATSRRLFLSRAVGGVAAAAALGTVGLGTYGVVRGPGVKRVTVPLAKLPRAAHGFRIAVVSDIHLGPCLGRGFAQRVVDVVNSTQPDLIAVVGDLVDGSVANLGPDAAPLAQLSARHGAYFVTGNHEYFSGVQEWVEEVRGLGVHPLENARTELPWFDLAGVNDISGESHHHGPDYAKALGGRDPGRAVVLMAHQPVMIHDAVKHHVDLQLSGHTHGGQLWPGPLVAAAANPTVAGLERYGDTQLYVSRGAGAWGPPTRVGAPSDVTVVELASRDA